MRGIAQTARATGREFQRNYHGDQCGGAGSGTNISQAENFVFSTDIPITILGEFQIGSYDPILVLVELNIGKNWVDAKIILRNNLIITAKNEEQETDG